MPRSRHRETRAPWEGRRSTWGTGESSGSFLALERCSVDWGRRATHTARSGREEGGALAIPPGAAHPPGYPEPAAVPVRDTGGGKERRGRAASLLSPNTESQLGTVTLCSRGSGAITQGHQKPPARWALGGVLARFGTALVQFGTHSRPALLPRARPRWFANVAFWLLVSFNSAQAGQAGCRPRLPFARSCHFSGVFLSVGPSDTGDRILRYGGCAVRCSCRAGPPQSGQRELCRHHTRPPGWGAAGSPSLRGRCRSSLRGVCTPWGRAAHELLCYFPGTTAAASVSW